MKGISYRMTSERNKIVSTFAHRPHMTLLISVKVYTGL